MMKTIKEIYWRDANYLDETQWLSKKDILGLIDKLKYGRATTKDKDGKIITLWAIKVEELIARINGK